MTELLVVLSHPDTLASGRPIAPGDRVPADELDPKDLHDARLIIDEAFVALKGQGAKAEPADLDKKLVAAAAATVNAGVAPGVAQPTDDAGEQAGPDTTDAAAGGQEEK